MYSLSLSCMSVSGLLGGGVSKPSLPPPCSLAGQLPAPQFLGAQSWVDFALPSLKQFPLSVPTSPRCLCAISPELPALPSTLQSGSLWGPTHRVAFGASGLGLPEGAPIGQLTSHRLSSLPGHTVNSAATSKANLRPDSYVLAFKNTRF